MNFLAEINFQTPPKTGAKAKRGVFYEEKQAREWAQNRANFFKCRVDVFRNTDKKRIGTAFPKTKPAGRNAAELKSS